MMMRCPVLFFGRDFNDWPSNYSATEHLIAFLSLRHHVDVIHSSSFSVDSIENANHTSQTCQIQRHSCIDVWSVGKRERLVASRMRGKMGPFPVLISFFYLIGLGMLGYASWSVWKSNLVATWPTAVGTIKDCSVATRSDGEGSTYGVAVSYQYKVGDQQFQNDRLAFGYGFTSNQRAQTEIVDRLRSANSVRVYYDPMNPQHSTLSYGLHGSTWTLLTFAILWLTIITGIVFMVWIGSGSENAILKHLTTT